MSEGIEVSTIVLPNDAPGGAAGGELTGTYPNPTVVSSHSGSTHAATQAAAEATAAAAAATHAAAADPHTGYVLESLLDAKGDIIVATADNTPARHAAGNDGEALIYDSNAADGIRSSVVNDAKYLNDYLAWSFDLALTVSTTGLTAATIHLARLPLRRVLSVTNIEVWLGTLGDASITHGYVGLYKSDGTLIGQSADQAAAAAGLNWKSGTGSTGLKQIPLVSGPFTVTPLAANDFVWAAFYVGTIPTTAPAFARATSTAAALTNAGTTNARARAASQAMADGTALTSPLTPASNTKIASHFWAGLS